MWRLVGAIVALSLTGLALRAGPAVAADGLPRREDGVHQEVVRVAPGVWVLAQPRFSVQPVGNVTVIEQSDGLVLVDAGGSPGSGRRIVGIVRSLSRKPVKAVIVTHWHGDHPQGLSEILKAWPKARTLATRATQAHLSSPDTMNSPAVLDAARNAEFRKQAEGFVALALRMAGEAKTEEERRGWEASARLFRQYRADMDGAITLTTSEGFDERLSIPDRTAPVEAMFLGRANTDGDAVVWLPRQRVLITGDIVVAPIPFGYGGYPAEWIKVLERLRGYPFRVLVPGHGQLQRDGTYLERLKVALSEIRAQVAPLAAQGLALEEVRKRVEVHDQMDRFVGSDPWMRRWFQEYWVAPIVASAYREARGQPIVQSLRGG